MMLNTCKYWKQISVAFSKGIVAVETAIFINKILTQLAYSTRFNAVKMLIGLSKF